MSSINDILEGVQYADEMEKGGKLFTGSDCTDGNPEWVKLQQLMNQIDEDLNGDESGEVLGAREDLRLAQISLDETAELKKTAHSAKVEAEDSTVALQRAKEQAELAQHLNAENSTEFTQAFVKQTAEEQVAAEQRKVDADAARAEADEAFDTAVPSHGDRLQAVSEGEKVVGQLERSAAEVFAEMVKAERRCRISDCEEPTIQKIQIKRGYDKPQVGDLAPGEMGYTQTYREEDGVEETHVWIGLFDGSIQQIFAKGDRDTKGSYEKLEDDLKSYADVKIGENNAKIEELFENLDTEAVDSIVEIVNRLEEMSADGDENYLVLSERLARAVKELMNSDNAIGTELELMREQHNFEIECMQKNLEDIDGGWFTSKEDEGKSSEGK